MATLVLFALLGGGRDPFTPLPPPAPPPDELCGEELCRFALDELKLVAIISGDSEPVAMFEEPRGKGLVARKNQRIGKRGGKVVEIHPECVTVLERGERIERCMSPAQ